MTTSVFFPPEILATPKDDTMSIASNDSFYSTEILATPTEDPMFIAGNVTMSSTSNDSKSFLSNVTNISQLEVVMRSNAESSIISLSLLAICVLGILVNFAVIYGIRKSTRLQQQVSNIFILNLSITDMGSASMVMFSSAIAVALDLKEVPRGLCEIQCLLNYCFIIVSMLSLAFVSMERYVAILHPLHYPMIMTFKKAYGLVIYSWFQGIAFGIAPVLCNWVRYDYWEAVCAVDWYIKKDQAVYYVIVACFLCFLLPGGIMVFCYIKVVCEIKKTSLKPNRVSGKPGSVGMSEYQKMVNSMHRQTKRTIYSLLLIVVLFFLFMTPFCVTKFLKVVVNTSYVPNYVNLLSAFFQYMSSCVNPFIYGFFRKDFRSAYNLLFAKLNCRLLPTSFNSSATGLFPPSSTQPANSQNLRPLSSAREFSIVTSSKVCPGSDQTTDKKEIIPRTPPPLCNNMELQNDADKKETAI